MDTFPVPCARCDEFRARFEAEGFSVLSCGPDPDRADMCLLTFERPTRIAPALAAPAGMLAGGAVARATDTPAKAKGKAKARATALAGPAAAAPAAMAQPMVVNVKGLNLRSTPSAASAANVLHTLFLGQAVEVIGHQQSGWWPVQLPDGVERGFVKSLIDDANGIGTPSLRTRVAPAREALVAEAVREWERFRFGQGKEAIDPFFRMVGEMWAAIGLPHDGREDLPWSAAAISFMVRSAAVNHAGYGRFKFAPSHSTYIHDAIVRAGQPDAPFHGFRVFEHKPQLGDLVARSREAPISFEQAAASGAFKSHTDVIVAIHADAVLAIGGNVSDSVSLTRYPKTDSGHLSDAGGVFALLQNNA